MHYKYKLGLTDAQIKTMKKLDVDFKKKIIQAKADHEMAHLELDLQVHSGEVNEGKIRAAIRLPDNGQAKTDWRAMCLLVGRLCLMCK